MDTGKRKLITGQDAAGWGLVGEDREVMVRKTLTVKGLCVMLMLGVIFSCSLPSILISPCIQCSPVG